MMLLNQSDRGRYFLYRKYVRFIFSSIPSLLIKWIDISQIARIKVEPIA